MRLFKRIRIILLALALFLTAFSSLTFAEGNEVYSEEYLQLLEETSKFRSEFGLKDEPNYVSRIVKEYIDSKSHDSSLGAILTKEEKISLGKRFEILDSQVPLITKDIKEKFKDNGFAGIYVDQKANGSLNIGFKKQLTEEQMQEFKNAYKSVEEINFYVAKYTEEELNALVDQIVGDTEKLLHLGIPLLSVSTDIINQKVKIGLEDVNQGYIETLSGLYSTNMIDVQKVEKAYAETSPSHLRRPLQGGLQIVGPPGNTCTASFTARSNVGTNYYLVTAGHCTGANGESWTQGGSNFGTVTSRKFNGGNNDSAIIGISSSNIDYYIYGNGSHTYRNMSSVAALTDDYVGKLICVSGATTNQVSCGSITTTNWTGNISKSSTGESYYFTNMRQGSYSSQAGDSGAPIFNTKQLNGVHSASGGIYSHVRYVMNQHNISPIIGGS